MHSIKMHPITARKTNSCKISVKNKLKTDIWPVMNKFQKPQMKVRRTPHCALLVQLPIGRPHHSVPTNQRGQRSPEYKIKKKAQQKWRWTTRSSWTL